MPARYLLPGQRLPATTMLPFISPAFGAERATLPATRIGAFDIILVAIFLIGLYTSLTIPITKTIPFPSAPAGVAGLILLWRRRHQLDRPGLMGMMGLLLVICLSILAAPDLALLPRRLTGLVQLLYSLVIGYALFLTIRLGSRRQIAALFLGCALVLLCGCLLETYGGLRPVSDGVRRLLYDRGYYDSDLRDVAYYGRVRPKFFASEPASVTFGYTLVSFLWLVVSTWRYKTIGYLALVACGMFAMPGATLLLMLVLLAPYFLFLVARKDGRLSAARVLPILLLSLVGAAMVWVLAGVAFPQRQSDAAAGEDPSSFYRVRGPAIAGLDIMKDLPLTGAGLTGEPFFEDRVVKAYVRSPYYSASWPIVSPATELVVNYFWLHWIYFGVLFGIAVALAVAAWLKGLGVPSPVFCFVVWAILGQASGAYVGPTCWAVLFLAGAAAYHNQRRPPAEAQPAPAPPFAMPRQWPASFTATTVAATGATASVADMEQT